MKAVSGFCVFVCILLCTSSVSAQDSVFTARQGFVAARQAINDSGYTDAYLVSIYTIGTNGKGMTHTDEGPRSGLWNGKAFVWTYTFFQPSQNIHFGLQVSLKNDTFYIEPGNWNGYVVKLEDDWMDSDSIATKNIIFPGKDVFVRLVFTEHPNEYDTTIVLNKMTWFWKSKSQMAEFFFDAVTGEQLYGGVVSIDQVFKDNQINLYPNPSSSNITVQLNDFTFTSIDILGIYGEILTSLKIPEGADNFTIPIENFPSSGQYFLRLYGRKATHVLTVTIYR